MFFVPRRRDPGKLWSSFLVLISGMVALFMSSVAAINPANPCEHHSDPRMSPQAYEIKNREYKYVENLAEDHSDRYWFYTNNPEVMHTPDDYRKIIINLEPCKGVVYLFVRKTRECWPNPYSCMSKDPNTGAPKMTGPDECTWTHFSSVTDGTRDGAPTFFELPLTSTKYLLTVYARETSSYSLTVLTDVGWWPRPGNEGRIQAFPLQELQIQLGWNTAYYRPPLEEGGAETQQYWIYSAMLLKYPADQRTNAAVFLSKRKIMNTVCGLHNNTDRPASTPIPASRCFANRCNATIDGVVTGKRYIFNVIAQSTKGFNMSYAGLILNTEYTVVRKVYSDLVLQTVGVITGAILGMVIIIYCWMINLYGK